LATELAVLLLGLTVVGLLELPLLYHPVDGFEEGDTELELDLLELELKLLPLERDVDGVECLLLLLPKLPLLLLDGEDERLLLLPNPPLDEREPLEKEPPLERLPPLKPPLDERCTRNASAGISLTTVISETTGCSCSKRGLA